MKKLKDWYTYKRQGIIYVQFKDVVTGKKLTAKSTRTRDTEEATRRINELYYNPESSFNKSRREKEEKKEKELLAPIIQEAVENALKTLSINPVGMPNQVQNTAGVATQTYPAEIRPIAEHINELTFYEYLLLFWNYDKSPYIKQLARLGKKIPNPERFGAHRKAFKRYSSFFNETKLSEISADEINTILGMIKNTNKLKDSTTSCLRYGITQALHFAYINNLLERDISSGITKFSNRSEEKEIFTKDELKLLFNSDANLFEREDCFLVNKLLIKTGCRIGEILALQIQDIIHTENGYVLNVSKSYNQQGKRLKETKTGRKDFVSIADTTVQELFAFIETNPFKCSPDAFIFYSGKKERPMRYNTIERNFNRIMKKLGIKRKGLSIHSYRHTYAVILAAAGFSQAELKYLTRHDSLKELQRYMSHVTPELKQKNREAAYCIDKVVA